MTEPHQAIILAIDPGKRSGWAIFIDGKLIRHGTARNDAERHDVVEMAAAYALNHKRKVVVVGESWRQGGRFDGPRTMAGLGASWGAWLVPIRMKGIGTTRILRVPVGEWRRAVHGGSCYRTRSEWHHLACSRATYEAGEIVANADEAEAICIGIWASKAAKVKAKLTPKRRRAKKA